MLLNAQIKRSMISRYGQSHDGLGMAHVMATLLPLALAWWVALHYATRAPWITVLIIPLITLLTLRVFALMHECGHGSLFRSTRLNERVGFLLGVVSGMPQFVWSKHHAYHHLHNGNWQRYRGPYSTLSIDEYEALTDTQRSFYRKKCSPVAAPLAGFIYLIFNPRFNWLVGSLAWVRHIVGGKLAEPGVPLREHAASFRTRKWKSSREYWHMAANNVVLLSGWGLMSWVWGPGIFFTLYLVSLSLAGGLGIVMFTVQHNFEHSYASTDEGWDHDLGAIRGTSFLVLPWWLNWFTVNIGYHHIHHLSARIPGYRLVQCHAEFQNLFTEVTRLRLGDLLRSLDCILWDEKARQIISYAEYRGRALAPLNHPVRAGE